MRKQYLKDEKEWKEYKSNFGMFWDTIVVHDGEPTSYPCFVISTLVREQTFNVTDREDWKHEFVYKDEFERV